MKGKGRRHWKAQPGTMVCKSGSLRSPFKAEWEEASSKEEETCSRWSLCTGPTPGIISEFPQERAYVHSSGRVPRLLQLESAVLIKHPSFLHSFVIQLSTP